MGMDLNSFRKKQTEIPKRKEFVEFCGLENPLSISVRAIFNE